MRREEVGMKKGEKGQGGKVKAAAGFRVKGRKEGAEEEREEEEGLK